MFANSLVWHNPGEEAITMLLQAASNTNTNCLIFTEIILCHQGKTALITTQERTVHVYLKESEVKLSCNKTLYSHCQSQYTYLNYETQC